MADHSPDASMQAIHARFDQSEEWISAECAGFTTNVIEGITSQLRILDGRGIRERVSRLEQRVDRIERDGE